MFAVFVREARAGGAEQKSLFLAYGFGSLLAGYAYEGQWTEFASGQSDKLARVVTPSADSVGFAEALCWIKLAAVGYEIGGDQSLSM